MKPSIDARYPEPYRDCKLCRRIGTPIPGCAECAAHWRSILPASVGIFLRVLARYRGKGWQERRVEPQQRKGRRVARAERRLRARDRVRNLMRAAR